MKKLTVSAYAVLLLLAMMHATLAQGEVYVDCGLKLSQASGVPDGTIHNYAFAGTCHLYNGDNTIDATGVRTVGTARWDGNSHTYTEHVHLVNSMDTTSVTSSSSFDLFKGGWSSQTNIGKGPHVGTDAEDATFNCDEDPVIHKGTACTVVSYSNATGWGDQYEGFGASASQGKPFLAGRATMAQATALSKHSAPISCSDLHLVDAHRMPNGKELMYRLHGTCNLYHTQDGSGGPRVTRVIIDGHWQAASQQAYENVIVLANPKVGGGTWTTYYTCTNDPWINRHAKCSETSQLGQPPLVYDPITQLAEQRPIALGLVNAKQASKLSNEYAAKQRAKQRGPSLVNRKVTAGAHSNVKNLHLPHGPLSVNRGAARANARAGHLHLGSSHAPTPTRVASNRFAPAALHPAHPGTMQRGARPKLADPNVRVINDNESYDRSCRDMHRLILVTATVRNDGGPLPMHRWEVFVMEGGGADLSSGGVWVPPLAPGTEATVQIPVLVLKGWVPKLPGTHWLKLISEGYGHKTTTALPPITLPAGICQPQMHMRSPTGMQRKANRGYPPSPCVGAKCRQASPKLNPQPEPPSSMHRLPAVQLR